MHMLRTCVTTMSCILLLNLSRNEMAHSTAASKQQLPRLGVVVEARRSPRVNPYKAAVLSTAAKTIATPKHAHCKP